MSDFGFLKPEYISAQRPKIITECINQYVHYLSHLYPEDNKGDIENFVKDIIAKETQLPVLDLTEQVNTGRSKRKQITLPEYISKIIKKRIISPSGSIYMSPKEKESFIRITIGDKKKERSKYKKIMLKHKEEGNVLQENIANYLQSCAKITNNSFSGVPQSPYNFLYCKANYASITGFARESIRCGFSHIELFLGANLFLRSLDDVVTYCFNVIKTCDLEASQRVIDKYKLHIPTTEEISEMFLKCLQRHLFCVKADPIVKYLSTLSHIEKAVVFYNGCLRNLLFYNPHFFIPYFKKMFDVENVAPYTGEDLASTLKQDEGIRMMTTSIHYEILGKDKDGKTSNPEKALTENPEALRKFIGIENHYIQCIGEIEDIITTFLRPESSLARMSQQSDIVRTNVIISDTDSAIFSTENIVEWYTGNTILNKDSFSINAFCVLAVVKSLEHRFASLSAGFGFIGKEIYGINMKNEYFMAAVLRPPLRKTYLSLNLFQEGKILPKPKLDVKGLTFRSSALAPESIQKVEEMAKELFEETLKKGKISGVKYLEFVQRYEQKIIDSLLSGSREFLKTESIKPASEYKNNPLTTSYFYADLWNKVFVPEFDEIVLPNKCFAIPLLGKGKVLFDPQWRAEFEAWNPKIFARFKEYLESVGDKRGDITRLVISPHTQEIPTIFRKIMDIRSIVYTNCSPLYLMLNSMGISYNCKKGEILIWDFKPENKTNLF